MRNKILFKRLGLFIASLLPLWGQGGFLFGQGFSPSTNKAYIQVNTARVAGVSDTDVGNTTKFNTAIQYLDGSGRTLQTVAYKASPNGKDLIIGVNTLDPLGRPKRQYLPVQSANSSGGYYANAIATAQTFYNDTAPYSEVESYDASPISRPLKTIGAGQAFRTAGNTKGTTQHYYTAGAGIRKYTITENASGVVTSVNGSQNYTSGDLMMFVTTDEDGASVKEFKDAEGKVIERWQVASDGNTLKTAWVYDDLGRLRYVIPPKAYILANTFDESNSPNSYYFEDGIYAFRYDGRSRLAETHVPNGGWSYRVYNELNQIIMTQNPLQRSNNLWEWVRFDGHGRMVMSGTWTSTATRATLQDYFLNFLDDKQFEERSTASGNIYGYTSRSFPSAITISANDVQRVYYFDNYAWVGSTALNFQYYKSSQWSNVMGLPTGSMVRKLDNGVFLKSVLYYDDQNRVIQTQTENRFSTVSVPIINQSDRVLSFDGLLLEERTIYRKPSKAPIEVATRYTYDNGNRVKGAIHYYNGKATPLAQYKRDDIGRLIQKRLMSAGDDYIIENSAIPNGQQDFANKAITLTQGTITAQNGTYLACVLPNVLQEIDYSYNIRGALRGINLDVSGNISLTNGDVFGYKLNYHEDNRYFSGLISKQTWQSQSPPLGLRGFTHTYDGFYRIQSSAYSGVGSENYSLSSVAYDENSNITSLARYGQTSILPTWGIMDNLWYNYPNNITNRLDGIYDYGSQSKGFKDNGNLADFTYYTDGSLKSDGNKGISLIEYNYMSLPDKITFNTGAYIQNIYDAEGVKLSQKLVSATGATITTDYMGDLIYRNDSLKTIFHDEGRIYFDATQSPHYQFFIADYLGNTRAIIERVNSSTALVQETHYGAWGEVLEGIGKSGDWNFLFQGKEWVDGLGYDFHTRNYDPYSGRFGQIDGANQFASGYVGMGNNPVNGIDPDGQFWNFIAGAAIGGYSGYRIAKSQGLKGSDMVGYILAGAGIGALTAGVGEAVLGSFSAAATSGMTLGKSMLAYGVSGAASGFVGGGFNAALGGGDFIHGASRGMMWGGLGGMASGALEHLSFLNNLENAPRFAQGDDPIYKGGYLNEVTVKAPRLSRQANVVPLPVNPWWGVGRLGAGVLSTAGWFVALAMAVEGDVPANRPPRDFRIALGTEDYLDDFSIKVGAASYKTGWASQSDTPEQIRSKIIALGMQENTSFHFNLSSPRGLINSPTNLAVFANKTTTIEYQTVRTLFPHKTTFYVKSGSIYKPLR